MKSLLSTVAAGGADAAVPARPHPRRRSRLVAVIGRWWQRSRDRDLLKRLDARQLRDIGLTRDEVEREMAKPFWRA